MGIADSMKGITENIISSYDVRVKELKNLVSDTHKTIKGFAADRKEMSKEQAKDLANFVKDLTKDVGAMMKEIAKAHKEMAGNLSESLKRGETDRLKDFRGVMGNIQKGIKDIENYVAKKLKEFSDAHEEMSEQQKRDLAKYVRGIAIEVKKLLGEYGSDMKKAKAAWRGMAGSLAKSRKGGVMPRVEAGEKVTTVEEAIGKKSKKKATKNKSARKKGVKKKK